eukprot:COSAG01_NODE_1872_length_9006_cov_523.219153_3_plen_445_part_00
MFITLEDPRAKVQGSRDPLGVQPIWSLFGREVVCNLTTVSRAVRGFTVTMLGRYFAEQLIASGRAANEDAIPVFLRCEQASAYARYISGEQQSGDEDGSDVVLGVTRVKKFLAEYNKHIHIANNPEGYILSDQRTYGLWGLYSVAARVSGLIADGPVGLTDGSRDFIQSEYAPRFKTKEKDLLKLFSKNGRLWVDKNRQPFKTWMNLLGSALSPAEREFFGQSLRDAENFNREKNGDQSESDRSRSQRQKQLSQLILTAPANDELPGRAYMVHLGDQAKSNGYDELNQKLAQILRLEATIAPAEYLFDQLLASDGQTVNSLAEKIKNLWGSTVPHLEASFDTCLPQIHKSVNDGQVGQLVRFNDALASGNYKGAVDSLIDWNKTVMLGRGSAAWVRRVGNKIEVKYRGRDTELPSGDSLENLWRNSYFIDSLISVCFQLEASGG